jgi:2-(1,2-epoxy-1,2-dihydrophenyl)acetyl-CoA isomerase
LEPILLSLAPALYNLGKPSIAAVNGIAVGAGFSLTLLCDIRITSDKATFSAGFIRTGLSPGTGSSFLLPRLIGPDKAMKLFLTGERINANEAFKIGLVTEVVPHDVLMDKTMALAAVIADGPSVAMELTKQAVQHSFDSNLESQLFFEAYAQNICRGTEDFKEAVQAFREKRPPEFKGI